MMMIDDYIQVVIDITMLFMMKNLGFLHETKT